MGKKTDQADKKTEEVSESVRPPIQENKVNNPISIEIYLKMIGVREWNQGGMIAYANKKAKVKLLSAEEWKELFKKY